MEKMIMFPSGLDRHIKVTVFYDTSKEAFNIRADSGTSQGKIVGTTSEGIYLGEVVFETEDGIPVIKGTYLGKKRYYKDFVEMSDKAIYRNNRWVSINEDSVVHLEEARMVSIFGNLVVIDIPCI